MQAFLLDVQDRPHRACPTPARERGDSRSRAHGQAWQVQPLVGSLNRPLKNRWVCSSGQKAASENRAFQNETDFFKDW